MALLPPSRIRDEAVLRLDLDAGDSVLEVGCGSGANLGRLASAVGPAGVITGIDLSPRMLEKAKRLRRSQGWENVTLHERDALDFGTTEPLDAVLFSLSYSVMPEPRRTLNRVWDLLAPGGRIVVVDAGLPEGRLGHLLRAPSSAIPTRVPGMTSSNSGPRSRPSDSRPGSTSSLGA